MMLFNSKGFIIKNDVHLDGWTSGKHPVSELRVWRAHLGPVVALGVVVILCSKLTVCVFIRCYAVIIVLVIILLTQIQRVWKTITKKQKITSLIWGNAERARNCTGLAISIYSEAELKSQFENCNVGVSPVGLVKPFPCCRRLASLRMSIMRVANSRALKRANFCRP